MTMVKKIFTLILLYMIWLYFYTWRNLLVLKDNTHIPEKKLMKDNLKTGDIIMMGNTKNTKVIGDAFFMINFFHPSMVVWEKNNLYILEYAFYPGIEGLNMIPFETWIRYNKNKEILHCPLFIKNEEQGRGSLEKRILDVYYKNNKKINKINNSFNWKWMRFLIKNNKKWNFDNITCTEVLAFIIYKSGIAKEDKSISFYHQSDFVKLSGFTLEENYTYNELYLCDLSYLIKKYI